MTERRWMRGERMEETMGVVDTKEEMKAAEEWRTADRRPMLPRRMGKEAWCWARLVRC